MVVVIAEVVFAGASDDVRTVDKVGVVVCFADEHYAAGSASTTAARIPNCRRRPVRISRHASVPTRRAPPAATENGTIPDAGGHDGRMTTTRRIRLFLVTLLTTSGVLHFVRPAPFISIVPRRLPYKAGLVAVSGAGELVCAALLAHPAGRRFGGASSALLFTAVFPANVSMAVRSGARPGWYRVALWARLPLQIPLVLWSLRIAREAGAGQRLVGRSHAEQ
jgi:uncharacterized membrane protein